MHLLKNLDDGIFTVVFIFQVLHALRKSEVTITLEQDLNGFRIACAPVLPEELFIGGVVLCSGTQETHAKEALYSIESKQDLFPQKTRPFSGSAVKIT